MKSPKTLLFALLLASATPLFAWWSQWTYEYYDTSVATVSADAYVAILGTAEGSGYIQMLYGGWTMFSAETYVNPKGSYAFELYAQSGPIIGYWAWAGYYYIDPLEYDGAWCKAYTDAYHSLSAQSESYWIE